MVHAGLLASRVRMQAFASHPATTTSLPRLSFSDIPVTGCVVLAYSCAAARDLHPLPIGRRVAGLRSCANLILRKSKNCSPANLPGSTIQSQTRASEGRPESELFSARPQGMTQTPDGTLVVSQAHRFQLLTASSGLPETPPILLAQRVPRRTG